MNPIWYLESKYVQLVCRCKRSFRTVARLVLQVMMRHGYKASLKLLGFLPALKVCRGKRVFLHYLKTVWRKITAGCCACLLQAQHLNYPSVLNIQYKWSKVYWAFFFNAIWFAAFQQLTQDRSEAFRWIPAVFLY